MENKLEYIPKKLYKVFQDEIIEYNNISNVYNLGRGIESFVSVIFSKQLGKNDYGGVFRSKDNSFTLNDGFYLTKKEAYDAYVELLEQEIKEKNQQALQLQMEALDIIGELNIFMEKYKDLEE